MAVKCILTGQDKIFVEGLLKGDGTGNITAADETEVELVDLPQQVFWATYGETTAAEVYAAAQENKLVCCLYQNAIYYLGTYSDNLCEFFSWKWPNQGLTVRYIRLTSGNWGRPSALTIFDQKVSVSLPTASWAGSDPYTQKINIPGSGLASKVDIQPSEEVYNQLVADNVGYLAIKNVNDTLTAVAKGGKPSVDLTVQVTYNNVY